MPVYEEYPVSVYREGMIKIDDFVTYNRFVVQHDYFGFRTIEIDMQANVDGADNLVPPNYIAVTTPTGTWGGIIYATKYRDSIQGNARQRTLTVLACSPVGFFKKRYITETNSNLFDTGTPYYELSGTQEYLIKSFIGLALSGQRAFPDFTVANNLDRGDQVTYATSFESLFQIVDTIINYNTAYAYDVSFNETSGFTFDLFSGNDLSDTIYLSSEQGIFSTFSRDVNFLEATNRASILTSCRVTVGSGSSITTYPTKTIISQDTALSGYNLLETVLVVNLPFHTVPLGEEQIHLAGRAAPYIEAYEEENKTHAYDGVVNTDKQIYLFNKDFYLGDTIGVYYDQEDIHVSTTSMVVGATETVEQETGYTIAYQWEAATGGLHSTFQHMKQQLERGIR